MKRYQFCIEMLELISHITNQEGEQIAIGQSTRLFSIPIGSLPLILNKSRYITLTRASHDDMFHVT